MAKMIEKLSSKLKKIKVEHLIVAVAIIVVLAIFFSTFRVNDSKEQSSSIDSYLLQLENKLSEKLSQIEGAGKVSVIISLSRGTTTEIATEKKVSNGENGIITEESPVLVSGKPIILSEIYPEVCGVIIIAKGASNIKVRSALMNATQTFLNITSEKIEILTMR